MTVPRGRAPGCPPTSPASCPARACAPRRRGHELLPLCILGLPPRLFPSPLQVGGPPLSLLLPAQGLVLGILEVLGCALPLGVQNQPLVVLRLRQDAGPRVEQRRGVFHSLGYGLEMGVSVGWVRQGQDVRFKHTPMLPLARSNVPMTPSMTSLMFLTPSSSLRRAASRASWASSASYRDPWFVVFVVVGVFVRSGRFCCPRRWEGDANRCSWSELSEWSSAMAGARVLCLVSGWGGVRRQGHQRVVQSVAQLMC